MMSISSARYQIQMAPKTSRVSRPAWNMFVDSHSGDLVRMELLDDGGVRLAIRQSEFRDVSGIRFPHQIEYLGGDAVVLARGEFRSR